MAEMSDRQRLEKLALEKEMGRRDATVRDQRRAAIQEDRQAQLLVEDQQKTEEILEYCKQQFQGFKLVPTGHEVGVDKAPSAKILQRKPDGVPFVAFSIQHWGDETNNFQGHIPFLLARYRNGKYQVTDMDGQTTGKQSFDELKSLLVEMLSEMGRESVLRLFEQLRSRWPE